MLPKGQMAKLNKLNLKNTDVIKANPERVTERVIRNKYSGLNGELGASKAEVKRALQSLSHIVKTILDVHEVSN